MASSAEKTERNIPEGIVEEIFSRLPAKSLCRLRCTSTQYRLLISNPRFILKHLNQNHERLLLISQPDSNSESQFYYVDFNELNATKIDLPSVVNPEYVGCAQGVILVLDKEGRSFCVNPATHEWKKLPASPFEIDPDCFVMPGLGYDSSTNDYKVVMIYYFDDAATGYDDVHDHTDTRIAVYRLRSNSWSIISGFPYAHTRCYPAAGVFFNGALHWITFSVEKQRPVIAAFNLASETFVDIPLPRWVQEDVDYCDDDMRFYYLTVVQGCLSMYLELSSEIAGMNEFWVMTEYGVFESWIKHRIFATKRPFCSLSIGLVLERTKNKFTVYNPQAATWTDFLIRGMPDGCMICDPYVENLVSLNRSNEIEGEPEKVQTSKTDRY